MLRHVYLATLDGTKKPSLKFSEGLVVAGAGLGVRVDSTPDVCLLRGYSHDPNAYFNHKAVPFNGLYKPLLIPSIHKLYNASNSEKDPLLNCTRLLKQAKEGERHIRLYKSSLLAGGYIAGNCIREESAIEMLESIACQWPNFLKSQKTIRDGISNGKQKPLYE